MIRSEYKITFNYHFDPARSGAKYSLDGIHWLNGGEFMEAGLKYELGFGFAKDANTPFDKGSDIEQTNTSVKSSKATLTSAQIGTDFDSIKKAYFERVHSDNWSYVTMIEDSFVVYNMNKSEFSEFIDNWASYAKERNVIRFKNTSGKMINWLEKRV